MPDAPRLREIAGPMLQARHDAMPVVRWSGGIVRRHGDRLHAALPAAEMPGDPAIAPQVWNWRRQPRLELAGGAWLELKDDPNGELLRSALPGRLTVAFRRADGSVPGLPGAAGSSEHCRPVRRPRGSDHGCRCFMPAGAWWRSGTGGAPGSAARDLP